MASVLPRAYIPYEWHDMKGTTHFLLSANGKTDVYAIDAWVQSTRAISTWSEIYDQAYDDDSVTAAEGADQLMDWAGYKDSVAPGKLHVPATISDWVMATVEELQHTPQPSPAVQAKYVLLWEQHSPEPLAPALSRFLSLSLSLSLSPSLSLSLYTSQPCASVSHVGIVA